MYTSWVSYTEIEVIILITTFPFLEIMYVLYSYFKLSIFYTTFPFWNFLYLVLNTAISYFIDILTLSNKVIYCHFSTLYMSEIMEYLYKLIWIILFNSW